MGKRLVTAVVGAPIFVLFVVQGGLWLRLALLALSLIGLYEFYRALSERVLPVHFVSYFFTVLYFLAIIDYETHALMVTMISGFVLLTFAMLVIFYQKISLNDCLITISGFFYVTFLLSFIYLVRVNSIYFVWLIFTSASASDTFAYIVGRMWGRHKLHGSPSPGKTWEGCIGGVLGAALVGFLYGQFVLYFTGVDHPIVINAMAISFMGAIFSILGDLFASAVKRSVNIKDFGKLLPGHGGVLDRFDSIIVTAPVVYMVIILMGYFGL